MSRSSAELEYRAIPIVTSEIVCLITLLKTFGLDHNPVYHDSRATSLYCDSRAALYIAANPVYHERTKHIEVDCHFIREKIQDGTLKTFHVPSRHQVADFFTKALDTNSFIIFCPR